MSTTDTSAAPDAGAHDAHHPTPRDYVRAAGVLAVLTLLEFSTYVVDFGPLGIPMLVGLIAIKFVMVANIFMHLKSDNRLYTRFLYGGLFLALTLYTLTLMIIQFASAASV